MTAPEGGGARGPGRVRKVALGLAALCLSLCFIPQCHLGPTAGEERFVTVRLHDSLARYDSVQVLILAEGDTGQVVGTIWDGLLRDPGALPSYRLADGETRPLSVRVKGFNQFGRLVLDLRISKNGDRQIVSDVILPKPSPALLSLRPSVGILAPPFDPAIKEYALALAYPQSSFTLTMTPAYAPASMLIGFSKAYPGKASDPVNVRVGATRIAIGVTAADTSARYSINVTRAAAPPVDTTITTPPDTRTDPGTGPVTLLPL